MPPVRFVEGTKTPYNRAAKTGTPSDYTDKQYKALNALKQTSPALVFGAARAEFVNKVLLADGTISEDLDAVRNAAITGDADDWQRLRAFNAKHAQALAEDALSPELKAEHAELLKWARHNQTEELEAMIALNRFLFIVDVHLIPRIYFQCVTPDNPDIDFVDPAQDPDRERRQSARDAIAAARAARMEG